MISDDKIGFPDDVSDFFGEVQTGLGLVKFFLKTRMKYVIHYV